MRILGIDPGSRRCGYGLIETRAGLRYVECGVIEPPARAALEDRLAELAATLAEVIDELGPTVVAVEDVFHGIDARAALVLGHARGVALAAAGAAKLPVYAYAPATVKRSVTGYGRADKPQVSSMVQRLLGLRRVPRADAADALAVAVCHAHHVPPALAAAQLALVAARQSRGRRADRPR